MIRLYEKQDGTYWAPSTKTSYTEDQAQELLGKKKVRLYALPSALGPETIAPAKQRPCLRCNVLTTNRFNCTVCLERIAFDDFYV